MDLGPLEEQARDVLPQMVFDYYAGGAGDEITLTENVAAWSRLRLRPHVAVDVSEVSTETTVLGTPVRVPLLVAPTAYHKLAHPEGEAETARGAAAADILMVVSTLATVALEDVAAAVPDHPLWFQLYVQQDPDLTYELVDRAEQAGYRALVVTLDLPVFGFRRRDHRNRFALPAGVEMANIRRTTPDVLEGSALDAHAARDLNPGLTVEALADLVERTDLPVLVKGVLRGDDARRCVDAGAAGVVVSNHGGRQLDTSLAGIEALPEVVAAVGGDVEVLVDGGVRSGVDVLKALALGARAVLIGRPVLWGLATGGAGGVERVLTAFADDIRRTFMLAGVPSVADVTPDLVVPPGQAGL